MRNQKSNQAFTLIEIAVVLIILGIIAVMALPGLFAQIERHRGQEAMSTMNLIKSSIESCGIQNANNFTNCLEWDEMGMESTDDANKFIYWRALGTTSDSYVIWAVRPSGDEIRITRASTGIATCAGTGAFLGFC